jgi:lipopolysaccharide biosynthesis regulator YciM
MTDLEEDVIAYAESIRWSDPDKAVRTLEAFVKEHWDATRAHLLLASLYSNEYGEGVLGAERIYREVLDKDPDNLAGLCGLALLHGHGANVEADESLRLLARTTELSDDPEMVLNLANKAWDLGKFEMAAQTFEKLRQIAKERRKRHLVRIAKAALIEVRNRKPPEHLAYSCPEM